MAHFGLLVHFHLKPDAGPAFDQLVKDTVEKIRTSEPGTLVYACHHVEGEPDARIFYELYQDRNAFERHEAQPHTQRFLSERDHYVAGAKVNFLSLTTSKGIDPPNCTS